MNTKATDPSEERTRWLSSPASYSNGDLEIRGFQVMQRWEDEYMRRLASIATSNGGQILEVGFGLGLSARHIESCINVDRHVIIECHPDVVAKARRMLATSLALGRVVLLGGFWEDIASELADGSFDGILFDTGPIDREVEFFHYLPFFREAYRLLRDEGVFTYFSDEPDGLSDEHLKKLHEAGFRKIDYEICEVSPPPTCRYWKNGTIVVPVIYK